MKIGVTVEHDQQDGRAENNRGTTQIDFRVHHPMPFDNKLLIQHVNSIPSLRLIMWAIVQQIPWLTIEFPTDFL